MNFLKLRLRNKLLLSTFAFVCLTWTVSGGMIATAIDEKTSIPLGWALSFLGASLAAAFYVGVYIKGVKDALVGIKASADMAHGVAMAANQAATAANLEAKFARTELAQQLSMLPCNNWKAELPKKCTTKKRN